MPSKSSFNKNSLTEEKQNRKPIDGRHLNMNVSNDDYDYIPCLYLPSLLSRSKQIILFFHANGEDLGTSYALSDYIRTALDISLLAIEYPGYGVYVDQGGPSEEKILRDAEIVY